MFAGTTYRSAAGTATVTAAPESELACVDMVISLCLLLVAVLSRLVFDCGGEHPVDHPSRLHSYLSDLQLPERLVCTCCCALGQRWLD